jgi:hypothetical protein
VNRLQELPIRIDLHGLVRRFTPEVDLDAAMAALRAFYAEVDRRNGQNIAGLDLPCGQGCDACCHQSVFLTPLEFLTAWDWAQRHLSDAELSETVNRGLELFAQHQELIEALDRPPPAGACDHYEVASRLRFRCPLLSASGDCRIYPLRELYARMFGCSFYEEGGIYGCQLVGKHLAGRTVSLLSVRAVARRLGDLPLTQTRQVYPYYIHVFYS